MIRSAPAAVLVDHEPAADRVVGALAQHGAGPRRTPRRSSRSGGTAATCGGAASGPGPGRRRSRARPSRLIRPLGPDPLDPSVDGVACRPSPGPRPPARAGPPCRCRGRARWRPASRTARPAPAPSSASRPRRPEPGHERAGGPHRPHRVRAGRADADAEQVENTDHGCASSPSARRTGTDPIVTTGLAAPLVAVWCRSPGGVGARSASLPAQLSAQPAARTPAAPEATTSRFQWPPPPPRPLHPGSRTTLTGLGFGASGRGCRGNAPTGPRVADPPRD